MESAAETFGLLVYSDAAMRETLPSDTYRTLKATIREGKDIDLQIANVVANAMKDWAVRNGATHFSHWFQPLTGATAEKHESFMALQKDGRGIMEFSGKELIKGEPDASSFPSGGLRATFEARGYTAWDPTSYAFIKEGTLCIPTAFCSFKGEALDKKTPLLRSMEVLSEQAVRILRLFGNTEVKRVCPTVGLEQEYFLVDKQVFLKRPDLKLCGRTLVGAPAPKGQELDDHYFGAIKPRVAVFMKKLDEILWKFGIPARTEHNEVAPSQHELAPLFSTVNLGVDQNQLMMEEMKKTADSLGLACLLHEKPFEGVNGSGKHNNWSLQTDKGVNLFEPGDSPSENAQFLLFLTAVIKAVDEYQGLLRMTVASASNDCRLGGNEAPPSVISMFLGDELVSILNCIGTGSKANGNRSQKLIINVHVLPDLPKDSTDRNRTSPMAFTGNKFEFRMLGSSFNAAGPNIVLDTAVASVLEEFADKLESSDDFGKTLNEIVSRTYKEHKRIIFNGNNYGPDWIEEAARRGLECYPSTVEASDVLRHPKTIELMKKYGVLGEAELESRREVILENYSKTVIIDASTLLEMVLKDIMPSASKYLKQICDSVIAIKAAVPDAACTSNETQIRTMQNNIESLSAEARMLGEAIEAAKAETDIHSKAVLCQTRLLVLMAEVRKYSDALEKVCSRECWSLPTYEDILFSV
ncbi:MAG: glutamine synthetase III [Sphaerochaetaceae bacterium]